MGYTKQEILDNMENVKGDIRQFYDQPFVNYTGKTTDSGEYYTEIVAEWILTNLDLFEEISMITRQNYKVHNMDEIKNTSSNRTEEIIAKEICIQKCVNILGELKDYQTPLKSKQDDEAGKIDLLAYDGSTLRILELKRPESKETMLRCVVEGYTYLKTVNAAKLIESFKLPDTTRVVACPLVFYNKRQHKEMLEGRPKLEELMDKWNCKPLYIDKNEDGYIIVEHDT